MRRNSSNHQKNFQANIWKTKTFSSKVDYSTVAQCDCQIPINGWFNSTYDPHHRETSQVICNGR